MNNRFYHFGVPVGVSLLILVFCLSFPQAAASAQWWMVALFMVALGIPHGATDLYIFQKVSDKRARKTNTHRFLVRYLGVLSAYAVLWIFVPSAALLLFLVISAYHFGQSNWHFLSQRLIPPVQNGMNVMWGTTVVFTPLLFHFPEAAAIISDIIRQPLFILSSDVAFPIAFSLFFLTFLGTSILFFTGYLSLKEFAAEVLKLGVLCALFYYTPLLLGFTVYFVAWHALGAMQDQIEFIQTMESQFTWKKYFQKALPFTVLAIAGLGAWYATHILFFEDIWSIGWVFTFIAIITLPHAFVIEELYKELNTEIKYQH